MNVPIRATVYDTLRSYLELSKPSITGMSAMMAGGGAALAPGSRPVSTVAALLIGTALAVAAANALNMVIERNSDALMRRTKGRPLPTGRLSPSQVWISGIVAGMAGVIVLWTCANPLTALLGAFALLSYAFVYTPLKRRTPYALVIGAVPGAMPPLMGWVAVRGEIEAAGLVLFGALFLWQVPHFLAIAIRLRADYARAGVRAVSVVYGNEVARRQAIVYASATVPVTLLLLPLGVAGPLYGGAALALGVWLVAASLKRGERANTTLFRVSLAYLPLLVIALVCDRLLLG